MASSRHRDTSTFATAVFEVSGEMRRQTRMQKFGRANTPQTAGSTHSSVAGDSLADVQDNSIAGDGTNRRQYGIQRGRRATWKQGYGVLAVPLDETCRSSFGRRDGTRTADASEQARGKQRESNIGDLSRNRHVRKEHKRGVRLDI